MKLKKLGKNELGQEEVEITTETKQVLTLDQMEGGVKMIKGEISRLKKILKEKEAQLKQAKGA